MNPLAVFLAVADGDGDGDIVYPIHYNSFVSTGPDDD